MNVRAVEHLLREVGLSKKDAMATISMAKRWHRALCVWAQKWLPLWPIR